jgi:hypothetical protein
MPKSQVSKRRRKGDTATFEELEFKEQSNSIKANIMGLQQAILANARRADQEPGHDRDETLRKRIKQIENLKMRLEAEVGAPSPP